MFQLDYAIEIDTEKCNGCGDCVEICPADVLELQDGERIECVLLREGIRRSICISTQVGCAMGCVFCASGLDGVVRNLTTGEIVEQMLQLQRLLADDERLSHIVVMGMGEPLQNYENS